MAAPTFLVYKPFDKYTQHNMLFIQSPDHGIAEPVISRSLRQDSKRFNDRRQIPYLVLGSGLDVGYKVAAVSHWIPHCLVQIGHANLEAHAIGKPNRRPSYHLFPDCKAFLNRPVSVLRLNALHTLLHYHEYSPKVTVCAASVSSPCSVCVCTIGSSAEAKLRIQAKVRQLQAACRLSNGVSPDAS